MQINMTKILYKRYKKALSFLLVIALVVSSLAMGFGQMIASAATDMYGTGRFYLEVGTRGLPTSCNSDRSGGSNSNFTVRLETSGGGVIGSFAVDGSGALFDAQDDSTRTTTSPAFDMVVNKTATVVRLTMDGSDNWYSDWWRLVYSYDGGSTWTEVARQDGDGNWGQGAAQTAGTSSFSGSVKTLTFNPNGGSGGGTWDAIPGQTITAPANATRTGYTGGA